MKGQVSHNAKNIFNCSSPLLSSRILLLRQIFLVPFPSFVFSFCHFSPFPSPLFRDKKQWEIGLSFLALLTSPPPSRCINILYLVFFSSFCLICFGLVVVSALVFLTFVCRDVNTESRSLFWAVGLSWVCMLHAVVSPVLTIIHTE